MIDALPNCVDHTKNFRAFDCNLRDESAADVDAWERMLVEWERDHSKRNPYAVTTTGKFVINKCYPELTQF